MRCPHPEKLCYGSKSRAKRTIKRLKSTPRRDSLHAYRCECGMWHIGHKFRTGIRPAA